MATFGTTIGSGGIRFYDADHTIAYNYVQGVYGGNFQGPLLLDTGDAEGSSTNLSAHWRVVGAMVERNVLVNNPEGIRIGDNYSSVPRDCTIRDNVVVDADTGAAITQRLAPSATVMTNNAYYASTTAAGMTQGADGIWRKAGFGPRLTYLELADVGPAGDLTDTDGTGADVGGGNATPSPASVLNIGTEPGQNHFSLQYAVDGSTGNNWTSASLAKVADGLSLDPYFKTIIRTINSVEVPVVHFQVRADSATTSGSSEPRSELREMRADGSEMAFDALSGDHTLHTRCRITHLPAADPEVAIAQLHNGVTGDRIVVRTQSIDSETKLLCRINGTQVSPRFDESYAIDDEFEVEIRVLHGGLVEVYYNGTTSPTVTGQLQESGAGASWYWKVGAYAAFNETTVTATEYVSVEHRDLRVSHGVPIVSAGSDAQVVRGQQFDRLATEVGLTGVTSRRWTIVARPTEPDPGPDPGPDLTTAAGRHGWGAPHALSDEFDYTGTPNPSKWALPGDGWAGHAGNGRRRPERQTVVDGTLIMTGLANGDSGWCRHRLDIQYGRWEARVRSFAGAPSAGEPDNTSNGNDYHPLLLLWPESNSRQTDGEYDFMENGEPGESTLGAFIHYPHPGTSVVQQEHFERPNSSLHQFHNIAMEWTSAHIKGFFDGVEWFSVSGGANSVRRDIQTMPAGHGVIQLDNFDGTNQTPATIECEWYRYYTL